MSAGSESENELQPDYGCGSILLTAIIMIGLITFNSFLVNQMVGAWSETYPGFYELPRLQRAIRIVAPVLLLVFEYWVYDLIRDRFWWGGGRRRFSGNPGEESDLAGRS